MRRPVVKRPAAVIILMLSAAITAVGPCTLWPCHSAAQTPVPESGTLILGPETAIFFFDSQCDASQQFLDVVVLLTREHGTSVKWVAVTSENPERLHKSLKSAGAVTEAAIEVTYDKQGKLLDDFGVMELPAVILTADDEIIYKLEKYTPLHNERLIEIVSYFAQGQKIPEAYIDKSLKIGDFAPDIMLPDVSGKIWSRKLYEKTKNAHSRILYVFTIMNCEPCREALKHLKENAHNMDDTEVVVISSGPKKLIMRELERMPLPFIVLCDENSETYFEYQLSDTPTIVLTCDDVITYVNSGWDSNKQNELMQVIANLRQTYM